MSPSPGADPPRRPAVSIVDLDDPTSAGDGLALGAQNAVQLQARPFQARRVSVDLGDVAVVLHTTSQRMRTRTTPQKDLLVVVVFGAHTRGTVNGVQVRPDLMLAVPSQLEVVFVPEQGWESVALVLAPTFLERHLAARQRLDDWQPPQRVAALKADEPLVRQLFDLGRRLADAAVQQPAAFDDSEAERAAAQVEVVETLLAALRSSSASPLARGDQTRQAQSLIVKSAEDFALARVGERIYVSDLCKATGSSERALEYAFKTVMGLTPVQYLTRLRLHRVREALLRPATPAATVSTIALDWGFWHFGDFSRAYKELFNELPSDTLRRGGSSGSNAPG